MERRSQPGEGEEKWEGIKKAGPSHMANPQLTPRSTVIAKSTFSKVRSEAGRPTLATSTQHSVGSPSHSNQRRKRNKRNPDWKRSKTLTVYR